MKNKFKIDESFFEDTDYEINKDIKGLEANITGEVQAKDQTMLKRLKSITSNYERSKDRTLAMAAAMEKIYEKAAQLGGKVSGEHGIGFAKKPYLRESLDPETIELMSGIKKAFDPKNILNPHKVFQS